MDVKGKHINTGYRSDTGWVVWVNQNVFVQYEYFPDIDSYKILVQDNANPEFYVLVTISQSELDNAKANPGIKFPNGG